MAKKQTRRSVSIKLSIYNRLKEYCETNHVPMSTIVEDRLEETFAVPLTWAEVQQIRKA